MQHRIYIGDSREKLKEVEPESVALCVTSPPYFVGRGYEDYLKSEQEYWELLIDVFSKVRNTLEPHGKVAINFADRYANSYTGKVQEVLYAGKYDWFMRELGFILWTRIIWDKHVVYSDHTLHLASSTMRTGGFRAAPNWEYIFVWKKDSPGKQPVKNVDMTDEERRAWSDGVWTFTPVLKNDVIGHTKLAMYPIELPYRLIKAYTQPGDVVLDPFGGTFTTAKAAAALGRNSISIELNPDMLQFIEKDLFNEYIIFR